MAKRITANFLDALVAVMAGNAAYFLLMPHMPEWARHVPMRFDAGIAVDFLLCLALFGLVRWFSRQRNDRIAQRNR